MLTTLEIAYGKARADAAGACAHAGYAREKLAVTELLAELMPNEGEALGMALRGIA